MFDINSIVSSRYVFYEKTTHELLKVSAININDDGKIISVIVDDETLPIEEVLYTNLVLNVSGVGTALCGEILYVQEPRKQLERYKLNFGWHINYSNQQLYTWFLTPADKHEDFVELTAGGCRLPKGRTLYYDQLSNVVGISKLLPTVLPEDLQQRDE